MPKPQFERKFAKFSDLKTIDDDPGGFEGHASISGNLDDGGDIILDGSFKDVLASFLRSGFTAHSHEWDIKDGVIGYPMEAFEDDNGLFVSMKFHSTDDAQKVRTKMRERIADGKEVGLSIGYRAGQPTFVYPKDFEKELPKYLKPEYLDEGMKKAKQFKYVRIIPTMAELKEFSVVTSAMNQESQVTAVKGSDIEEQIVEEAPAQGIETVEEKIGARNSSPDRNRIKQIHDLAAMMEPTVCSSPQKSADDAAIIPLRLGEAKGIFQEALKKFSQLDDEAIQTAFDETLKQIQEKAETKNSQEPVELKAEWTTAYINDLPDTCFAYIESGGEKDENGKTTPRSLRHFPFKDANGEVDAAHVRNALARIPQSNLSDAEKEKSLKKIKAAADKVDVEVGEEQDNEEAEKAGAKRALSLERFRFEKLRTNALRQRAAQAG